MLAEQTKAVILVVDDEVDILELIRYNLDKNGYHVLTATSGEEALKKLRNEPVDLLVLDLMLPGMDGLEVCRRLKSDPATNHILVVMLTAKTEETDVVIGLELGADDYITKPFSPRVLLARIKAMLRRKNRPSESEKGDATIYAAMVIHPGRHEVLVNNQPIDLTATEFQILHFLARRPGWVFSRAQIVDTVRGVDYPVTDRTVDVHIAALRKKLGSEGKYIETVRGIGYRLRELS